MRTRCDRRRISSHEDQGITDELAQQSREKDHQDQIPGRYDELNGCDCDALLPLLAKHKARWPKTCDRRS
ncbi:MAG: hypothetical protein K8I60_12195 [Anaerolineae bacterium]|nr:hypothetical protein [Anaerolineae bacterium]